MRIPLVVNGLDDKPQRGADGVHILAHDLLDDGRLARIVKSSASLVPDASVPETACRRGDGSHSIKILSSLSLSRAFRRIDNISA